MGIDDRLDCVVDIDIDINAHPDFAIGGLIWLPARVMPSPMGLGANCLSSTSRKILG